MPEKHRGVVDFSYAEGAFRPLSPSEPFQLLRLFEYDSISKKSRLVEVSDSQKLLVICTAGEGCLKGELGTIPLVSDTIAFVSANGQYEFLTNQNSNTLRCICLYFHTFSQEDISVSTELFTPCRFFLRNTQFLYSSNATEVREIMDRLLMELSLPKPTMLLVKGLFYQLLITSYRRLVHHAPSDDSSVSIHAVGHTVYAIIRYIDDNLFSLHNLMDMARELGYSYNYLSHLFRKRTGMTIQAYVSKKKIEQSKMLLLDHRYSITEIATMLNYDCIQSFSKAFRRAMNMSPTEYRSKNGI